MKHTQTMTWEDAKKALAKGEKVWLHVQGRIFPVRPDDSVDNLRLGLLGGLDVSIADVQNGKFTLAGQKG